MEEKAPVPLEFSKSVKSRTWNENADLKLETKIGCFLVVVKPSHNVSTFLNHLPADFVHPVYVNLLWLSSNSSDFSLSTPHQSYVLYTITDSLLLKTICFFSVKRGHYCTTQCFDSFLAVCVCFNPQPPDGGLQCL